jgi:hypothetical protein
MSGNEIQRKARITLVFFFLIVFTLTSCQSAPTTPPADTLWVDTTQDLGTISPYVLGGNHGPWAEFNPFALEKTAELGITFMRWPGGNWGDRNDVQNFQIDTYIAQARKIGAEPSFTVRLPGNTPENAAAMVRYVNIEKGYGVKYWSIGNEPSLYTEYPDKSENWEPAEYAKRWREFALAMEAVDPNILLYGPDVHQFTGDDQAARSEGRSREYLIEFLKVNGDMVDIVTVHRYPFPTCSTCGNPSWAELRENTKEWSRVFPNLRRLINETTGKDLPVGMLEYNSNYTNTAGAETSPDSFYSALWLADVYGRMVNDRPELLAIWLLKDNNGGLGLMTSFDVRPSYYTFKMWQGFGNHLLAANSDTEYVSIYASKRDDGTVTVILVNLNDTEIRKPLQFHKGDDLKLTEAYLFDSEHNAESISAPEFSNGDEIVLPKESVTLFILK